MLTRDKALIVIFWATVAGISVLALAPGSFAQGIMDATLRHIFAFVTLPGLAILLWPRVSLVLVWIAVSLFGGAIELAQGAMAMGRTASMSDWALDSAAAAAVILAVLVLRAWAQAREVGRQPIAGEANADMRDMLRGLQSGA